MTTNRVAEVLGVSGRAVRAACQRGTLRARRAGRDWDVGVNEVIGRARTLIGLRDAIKALSKEESDGLDWASLPTFGGSEPADTREVWSWDDGSVLVGTCAGDLQIVSRGGV